MFKFMKSKKGFSLVELMIVVVIMAILVAVAVPIFNSVTGNARAKTCIDNQRTIISTLNTDFLENPATDGSTITIKTNDDGDGATVTGTGSYASRNFDELFQTIPYCPVKKASILVTISKADEITTITTACTNSEGEHSISKS